MRQGERANPNPQTTRYGGPPSFASNSMQQPPYPPPYQKPMFNQAYQQQSQMHQQQSQMHQPVGYHQQPQQAYSQQSQQQVHYQQPQVYQQPQPNNPSQKEIVVQLPEGIPIPPPFEILEKYHPQLANQLRGAQFTVNGQTMKYPGEPPMSLLTSPGQRFSAADISSATPFVNPSAIPFQPTNTTSAINSSTPLNQQSYASVAKTEPKPFNAIGRRGSVY